MSESYIQNLFAERIGGKNYGKDTAIYKFEKIKRAKRAALAKVSRKAVHIISGVSGDIVPVLINQDVFQG